MSYLGQTLVEGVLFLSRNTVHIFYRSKPNG